MKSFQAVKQKVCVLFLAIGMGLASIHQIGCFKETNQIAESQGSVVKEFLIILK